MFLSTWHLCTCRILYFISFIILLTLLRNKVWVGCQKFLPSQEADLLTWHRMSVSANQRPVSVTSDQSGGGGCLIVNSFAVKWSLMARLDAGFDVHKKGWFVTIITTGNKYECQDQPVECAELKTLRQLSDIYSLLPGLPKSYTSSRQFLIYF